MRGTVALVGACFALICVQPAWNQTAQPAFEAASIKAVRKGESGASIQMKGGPGTSDPARMTCTYISLHSLLVKAFDVDDFRVIGPAWLSVRDAEMYTITATMAPQRLNASFNLCFRAS